MMSNAKLPANYPKTWNKFKSNVRVCLGNNFVYCASESHDKASTMALIVHGI